MRIALIEDNRALARGLAHRLRVPGHAVDELYDGDSASAHLATHGADLIILDLKLPGRSGLEVLRALRRRGDQTPVLILSAQCDTEDLVAGLDAGADDYLAKPFVFDELAARIRALSRRRVGEDQERDRATHRIGGLRFDRGGRRLFAEDGAEIVLPRKELAALECLLDRRGRLASKAILADHLYGAGADVEERVVEVYISRLRKRLAAHGVSIKSSRGLGYALEPT